MMLRIHIAETAIAEKVQNRLSELNFNSYLLKSGCKYENGRIIEFPERAWPFAVGYLDSLNTKWTQEC